MPQEAEEAGRRDGRSIPFKEIIAAWGRKRAGKPNFPGERGPGRASAGVTYEIDLGEGLPQEFTWDCSVCCRPMEVSVAGDDRGEPVLSLRGEDDLG